MIQIADASVFAFNVKPETAHLLLRMAGSSPRLSGKVFAMRSARH